MSTIQRLLGGRPMTCLAYAFEDIVTNKRVYCWFDCYGRSWLSTSKWGWFRVPSESPEIWLDVPSDSLLRRKS